MSGESEGPSNQNHDFLKWKLNISKKYFFNASETLLGWCLPNMTIWEAVWGYEKNCTKMLTDLNTISAVYTERSRRQGPREWIFTDFTETQLTWNSCNFVKNYPLRKFRHALERAWAETFISGEFWNIRAPEEVATHRYRHPQNPKSICTTPLSGATMSPSGELICLHTKQ